VVRDTADPHNDHVEEERGRVHGEEEGRGVKDQIVPGHLQWVDIKVIKGF